MKTKMISYLTKLCAISAAALVAVACEDDQSVSVPTFEVSADKATVRVGERAVFNFEGNADIITFYSGEDGSSWNYRETNRILPASMYMSFSIKTSSGTEGYPNPARLPLYYSTDFSGNYTLEDLQNATWVEVTDLFKMPTDVGQQVYSGSVCIDSFYEESETIYLAMFYQVDAFKSSAAGGKGNGRTQWNVMSFFIEGVAEHDSAVLYENATAGWTFVYQEGFAETPEANMPDISSSRILFRSEFKPTTNNAVWCVSGALKKREVVDLGYDRPMPIKSYADPTMTTFHHIYEEPGEYTATFLGVNASVYGREEVVRHVNVSVVHDGGSIDQPTKEEWK